MAYIEKDQTLKEIKSVLFQKLSEAVNDRHAALREIVFATTSNGIANLRTVILRAFDENQLKVTIYTDARSAKVQEIKQNDQVSILAYDAANKCQLKLFGKARLHVQDSLTQLVWDNLKGGKKAYNTLIAPGEAVRSLDDAHTFRSDLVLDDFCVIQIELELIELLQLSGEEHIRVQFDLLKNQSTWLVP